MSVTWRARRSSAPPVPGASRPPYWTFPPPTELRVGASLRASRMTARPIVRAAAAVRSPRNALESERRLASVNCDPAAWALRPLALGPMWRNGMLTYR